MMPVKPKYAPENRFIILTEKEARQFMHEKALPITGEMISEALRDPDGFLCAHFGVNYFISKYLKAFSH